MIDTLNALSKISDKTDTTDITTNDQFMEAIFKGLSPATLPLIVSFDGNPANVNKGKWLGLPWGDCACTDDQNAYFSLASFHADDKGKYRRQKKYFHSLHAIMLDDIGTKVPKDRLTLEPSWMLETSTGNYQAGYILADPVTDAALADRLMKAIIQADLCDPGAGGPTARLARLPFAVNGKHNPPFRCNLEAWYPDLCYTVDELVDGLELNLLADWRARKAKARQSDHGYEDDVFIPRPQENSVIVALKERGLYKAPLGDGKHDMTCPWVHEHTDGIDSGTVYFDPSDQYPLGGFKCHHGHCADRHIKALLDFLEVDVKAARMKATIRCVAGEIHQIVDKAELELSRSGKHYQRGGLIVTITTDPSTHETCVKDIRQNALIGTLSAATEWERYDKRSDAWCRIDPPTRAVSVLYDANSYQHLPVLNGLAHQPFLRENGSLAIQSGYDQATGMFGVFKDAGFAILDQPTKQDAQDALALIADLLSEFSFADEVDRAAAISAILTAAIRPSLSLAPMYHVRAPQISSGKSFLCQIIGLFASPRLNSPTSFPQDDEECRKLLLSELLRAPAVIEFDNLTTDLIAHKSLCTSLTSEFLTGRILGVSKTATVSTRTLFLSSGNNVGPIHDMTRRCLTINLDPACERPATRTFKRPDLLSDVKREREKYVSAALTIVRAWIENGRAKTECKTLASYGQWSDLCRQPLLWLGLNDPAAKIFAVMDDDPDRDLLGRLLQSWHYNFGSAPKMVRDAVNKAETSLNSELHEILTDIAADRHGINRRILGHWIKRHARQVVDGFRFVAAGGSRSAAAWRVEKLDLTKSVSSVVSEF